MSGFSLDSPFRFLQAGASARSSERGVKSALSRDLLAVASMDEAEVLAHLGSSLEGLNSTEAVVRLARHGPNLIAQNGAPSALREFIDRASNPLNALLLALAVVSYGLGDLNAAIVILVIVALAILLAFIQEHRSNDAAARLRAMVKITTSVRRRRDETAETPAAAPGFEELASEMLVSGDIVRLSAGDMVPADLRLLSSKDLFVDQSALTGESMPCEKSAQPSAKVIADAFDAPNLALMGSSVISGFTVGVIVRTGARTYFGQLAEEIAGQRRLTEFDKGVNRFIGLMIRFMLVLAPAVFLINGMTKGDWAQALLFGLAVAVGLTPELLPMIVTVNLAKGAIAMSKKLVIVKRLNAIQNFGAMDVLCTDKTGTLTQNKIALSLHLDIRGQPCERTLEYAYLNSRHQSGLKSLLDEAVVRHVEKDEDVRPYDPYRCVDEIPFDFERRRLSVILDPETGGESRPKRPGLSKRIAAWMGRPSGERLLICKGAVEELVAACAHCELDGQPRKFGSKLREQALEKTRELSADGLRVMAVAYKEIARSRASYSAADENGLTLLGFIAFLDPPKESAGVALTSLKGLGIAVKILTGDNEIVTRKICRDVGLEIDRIALGSEIEAMTDGELAELVETVTVFAKVAPEQKARIIAALHSTGHVVGFLGDGVNDSLALKAADVGVSVDSAVDIAKESADIILLEKSLLVLQQGVLEGRKVFGNIIKYIKMGASSNFGSMFSMLGASLLLPFLPMLPVQVLANNLLYDFSQATIPSDNVDQEFLAAPRKWNIDNIFRFMVLIGPISSIFDYTTFFVMLYVFDGWNNPSLFQTGWFVESLLTQTLIIHVIRTEKIPFLESRASATLTAASLIICLIGVALPYTEIGQLLKFTPLPASYWPILAATLVAYGVLTQVVKTWLYRHYSTTGSTN
ncbi:MAG: HAD-IC family P-type ATPase [Methylocystis sp.]